MSEVRVTSRIVQVKTRFTALHQWIDAPEECKFLCHPHRHEFHVSVMLDVAHNERDIEIVGLKNVIDHWLWSEYERPSQVSGYSHSDSCETMAEKLGVWLMKKHPKSNTVSVQILEDGENGAVIQQKRVTKPTIAEGAGIPVLGTPYTEPAESGIKFREYVVQELPVPLSQKGVEGLNTIRAGKKTDPLPTIRLKPFFGIEAEGPFKGIPTFFVPCGAKPEHITAAFPLFRGLLASIAGSYHLKSKYQIYLGAGDSPVTSKVNPALHTFCLGAITGCLWGFTTAADDVPLITMEVSNLADNLEAKNCITKFRKDLPASSKYRFNVVSLTSRDFPHTVGLEWRPDFWKIVTNGTISWEHQKTATQWKTSKADDLFQYDIPFDLLDDNTIPAETKIQKFQNLRAMIRSYFSCPLDLTNSFLIDEAAEIKKSKTLEEVANRR